MIKYLFVLVHGTWAGENYKGFDESWTQDQSTFRLRLKENIARLNNIQIDEIDFITTPWEAGNNERHRIDGAKECAKTIKETLKLEKYTHAKVVLTTQLNSP